MAEPRRPIAVLPEAGLVSHRRLWETLQAVFPVRFCGVEAEPEGAYAAVVELEGGSTELGLSLAQGLPRLTLTATGETGVHDVGVLGESPVDRTLRGIQLFGQEIGVALAAGEGTVLAVCADGPVWTRCRQHDQVAGYLPALEPDETLLVAVHGPCSLALIALIELIRAAAGETAAARPGLRAALVFDDPNVRIGRYGFIRYRDLLDHAERHDYHAVMAMVPADAGHWSAGVVEMFRAHGDRLSLAIHGNDHTRHELLSPPSAADALAVCAQSLRRAVSFESQTGLAISRVMVPPHSGWSRLSARALARLGFDAICTVQFQPSDERPADAPGWAGFHPADFIEGCAVLPRVPLTIWATGLRLRAFLGHPLIVYGHHGDVADGLDRLAETAAVINGIGEVRWSSLAEIAASNYGTRRVGTTLIVAPWALRLRLEVPFGVRRIVVQAPPTADEDGRLVGWALSSSPAARRVWGETVNVMPGSVEVRLRCADAAQFDQVAEPAHSMIAVARRRLTEARDQLAPPISTVGRRIHARAR